ncbi:MAG: hypothetical protein KAS23_02410 [Anaerohalosphaera sp.]|nr:hypothetical protein [Anaerohalosphaera sp.]
MSKLERNSCIELASVTISVPIFTLMMHYIARENAKGLVFILITVVIVGITLFACTLAEKKVIERYDEREKKIKFKTFRWSAYVFVGYVMLMSFGAFFTVGGAGTIEVVHLPIFFVVGCFIAQLAQTAMTIILCNTGADDE